LIQSIERARHRHALRRAGRSQRAKQGLPFDQPTATGFFTAFLG
jgi:hypothetical protein